MLYSCMVDRHCLGGLGGTQAHIHLLYTVVVQLFVLLRSSPNHGRDCSSKTTHPRPHPSPYSHASVWHERSYKQLALVLSE